LPHRHARDDGICQVGGTFVHAPCATRRAEAAPLATEGDQGVFRAGVAGEAQETVGQDAAREVGVEFVGDEARQVRAGRFAVRRECACVLLHQPVERCLFGAVTLVAGGTCSRRVVRARRHEDFGVTGKTVIIYSLPQRTIIRK